MKRVAMPRRSSRWIPGNHFELLENGEAFFPAVFQAIAQSRCEVLLETFIVFEDKVGLALHEELLRAARRGVRINMLVDGFGSSDLSAPFIAQLVDAGVQFHVFDPVRRFFGRRLNVLRRMHRKLVVVDGETGFIGGINYSADHLADFGPLAKQDYAVLVRGPIVSQIQHFMHDAAAPRSKLWSPPTTSEQPAGDAQAMFITRDNHRHPHDIERHYRVALRAARSRAVIANAYFFPGYRLIREIRRAARRGVDVRLILQGEPDMPIVRTAASLLYEHLLRAGVRIYEYCERPLHGKVALVDGDWSTVGSSNLDPLSLALNLEANVVIRHAGFNDMLYARLSHLMENSCKQIKPQTPSRWERLRLVRNYLLFHVMRWFPTWAGWLPRHDPTIAQWHPFSAAGAPAPDGNRPRATV